MGSSLPRTCGRFAIIAEKVSCYNLVIDSLSPPETVFFGRKGRPCAPYMSFMNTYKGMSLSLHSSENSIFMVGGALQGMGFPPNGRRAWARVTIGGYSDIEDAILVLLAYEKF